MQRSSAAALEFIEGPAVEAERSMSPCEACRVLFSHASPLIDIDECVHFRDHYVDGAVFGRSLNIYKSVGSGAPW